jgi:voltage-gated potassium channel
VMARPNLVERQFAAFLRTPLSVRKAMGVIVTATVVSVVIGGVAITLLDADEFPDVGTGLWWALQTVTTVGYGDVTPENAVGRVVGAVIMLESIAFVAIVTAAITSSFVERARREQAANAEAEQSVSLEDIAAQLADIRVSLARIQRTMAQPD